MPLHIIKMTMIVIFVPSPPHHLLFSTVPLALPPSSSPRLPGSVPGHRHSHTNLRLWALREGERDLSFSFSFLRPETGRHAETGRTQKFLLVPFTLFFLLVPTYSYVSLGVSLSLVPPLTRSFLLPVQPTIPLYTSKRFRAGLYLRRAVSFSACRGRLIVARLCWPTADRIPVYVVYKRRQ